MGTDRFRGGHHHACRRTALAVTLVFCGLALASCGGDAPDTTTTTLTSATPPTTPETAPDTGTTVDTVTRTSIASTTTSSSTPTTATPRPHTPPIGDPVRASIMDAQRAWMASRGLPSDVVFVVDTLNVLGTWAFSQVRPESRDGTSKYEGLSFLLRNEPGGWTVVDAWGASGDNEGETAEDYFQTRNPAAPVALFR